MKGEEREAERSELGLRAMEMTKLIARAELLGFLKVCKMDFAAGLRGWSGSRQVKTQTTTNVQRIPI